MPRLFGIALRWALLPLLLLLATAMASEFWRALCLQGLGLNSIWHPLSLCLGFGIGVRVIFKTLMHRLGKDDPLEFLDTLEHELTHALVGILTFCPPTSLSATLKSGGEVQLRGRNLLAVLAPYFIPLWCSFTLTVGLFIRPSLQPFWSRFLFFLFGIFLYRLSREYRWRQTDLHVYGFFFSSLCVFMGLLLVVGLLLHSQHLLGWQWLKAAGIHAWTTLPILWHWALQPT